MARKKKTSTDTEIKEKNVEEEVTKKETKEDAIEDLKDSKKTDKKDKSSRNVFTNTILVITIMVSLVYFVFNIINDNITFDNMINTSILVLFSIIYLSVCLTYNKKNKFIILISSILLMAYFLFNISNLLNNGSISSTIDFRGKTITEAMKLASKNDIKLEQDYEYSDLIDEYKIISQKNIVDKSNKLDKVKVSISEGPNPSKEIVVPSMITWDSERVINFVKKNYLNNVVVEFVESDKVKDTVIEQNTSGNLKRDEELKLTFSYGDEGIEDNVKLIDFTNKSKFEIEFFMKQHQLNYSFDESFSKKIKKGYGVKQSVKAGEVVSINDKEIIVTLSKGPKIVVPDLVNMSSTKITEWAVKNKLKLEFIDKYDDSVKEGNVIETDKEKGDILEQGSLVKVTISKGKLKMPNFKTLDEFTEWADKYEIKYEIQREFSKSVKTGDVISYSIKPGKTIKNGDIIIVKVSDGENCEVPNLKGLTKSEAISKLKKAELDYNFVYKSSDSKKDKVLSQSISSGSSISCGTTITVTLSSGKDDGSSVNKKEKSNDSKPSSSSSNNNNSSNNNSNNNGGNNNTNTNPEPTPVPTCNACTIYKSQISDAASGYDGNCNGAAASVKSKLQASCPGLVVNVSCEAADGFNTNDFVRGFRGGKTDSCSTISIVLAK